MPDSSRMKIPRHFIDRDLVARHMEDRHIKERLKRHEDFEEAFPGRGVGAMLFIAAVILTSFLVLSRYNFPTKSLRSPEASISVAVADGAQELAEIRPAAGAAAGVAVIDNTARLLDFRLYDSDGVEVGRVEGVDPFGTLNQVVLIRLDPELQEIYGHDQPFSIEFGRLEYIPVEGGDAIMRLNRAQTVFLANYLYAAPTRVEPAAGQQQSP